ncbi:hypothetical protein TRFO_25037 [Tritrichomonas foetus]|uniref:Uncharacterized protein n=1 Tax=Tritrichomonas foetus TaxID=1144522 RepID=A0A1J4KBK6_9EUKA|nr:hypothetical protein TRFO_25037 [Tritrichomonas foetus]|eukprot:OHT06861.1 hypothetical protein TRFO_25037 [Tritrichomonas foetus]
MENEDITQMVNRLVKKTEETISIEMEETDSRDQARRLLTNWANQTESFRPSSKKNTQKKPKTVQYRKLDAPMMVAKKETHRPSVDPTLIMEARLAHVKEMKAKRLERQAKKNANSTASQSQASSVYSVDIPDIESEIQSHRNRVAERMKEKQKEIDGRIRRMQKIKVIEENVAQVIALENEERIRVEKIEQQYEDALQMKLQLLDKNQQLRKTRKFFTLWTSECNFHSDTYKKAAVLSNFRCKSAMLSVWKSRLRKKIQEREVNKLERLLRRNKQLEATSEKMYIENTLRKSLTKWRIKYKASIEYKIIEEQHKKRRDLILKKINFVEENENEIGEPQQIEEPQKPIKKSLKMPKTKIKQIKPNSRMEAMAKRMEEQRLKNLKKAQKEAEEISNKEEEELKQQMEMQRKKKQEHRQFLEKEKIKREEIKKKQMEFEREAQRRKYCEKASQEFRLKWLKLNQLRQWRKILVMREDFEKIAEKNYHNHLLKVAINSMILFSHKQRNIRNHKAEIMFNQYIQRIFLMKWNLRFNNIQEISARVEAVSNKWRVRKALRKLFEEKKKKRKGKYMLASQHANRYILRKFFNAWPIGCEIIREEEERENNRQDLMSKALKFLEELSSDSISE